MSTDNEIVPPALTSNAPILRVANEIERERPRVAYLCRFCAFEKACRVDPSSSGRGVSVQDDAPAKIGEEPNWTKPTG